MHKILKRILCGFIFIGFLSIAINTFMFNDSYANSKPNQSSLYKLSLFQGVMKCYEDYARDTVLLGEYNEGGYGAIFEKPLAELKSTKDAWVTTEVGNTAADGSVGCKQIFLGGGGINGLESYYEIPNSLRGLGYELDGSDIDSSKSGTANADADQIIFNIRSVDNKGGNDSKKMSTSGEVSCKGKQKLVERWILKDYYTWVLTECSGSLSLVYDATNETLFELMFSSGNDTPAVSGQNLAYDGGIFQQDMMELSSSSNRLSLSDAFNSSTFKKHLIEDIERAANVKYNEPDVTISYRAAAYGGSSSTYKPISSKREAAGTMLYALGVDDNLPNLVYEDKTHGNSYVYYYWNDDWKYALYYNYFKNMLKKYPEMSISGCSDEKPSSKYMFKNSSTQWCAIDNAEAALDEKVSIPISSMSMGEGRFEDILVWFNDENSYSKMSEDAYALESVNSDGTINITSEDGNEIGDACHGNSGVLGWIICPIVEGASGIGEYMWERIENYHLKVPAQEVFKSDGGVEQAWSVIRDLANILFIILLLFVIFSQLTGVGIDNYGIKKIMPKLVLVAVLVNLSYIICQLAVDLSNILGMGLNSVLSGFASGIESVEIKSVSGASVVTGWTMDLALGGGAAALYGVLAGGTTLMAAGAAIGLLVLGVVITAVVALLTLYLILVVREAGIILAVVVAPVAIVCYMLPNTEKLYKKWFNIFKALLLVYPICGALVGAGQLAGATLASIGTGSMSIAAMIVQVLPFFFIPMILKSSMALMGNLGAKISTFGRSLGSRGSSIAKSTIRNTEGFKEMSQFGKDASILRRAQRIHNRYSGRKNLSERDALRLRKADTALLGRAEEVNRARNMAGSGFIAAEIAQQKKAEADAVANEIMLVSSATNGGANEDELMRLYDDYDKAGNEAGKVAIARIAGRRADTANRFMDKVFRSGDYSAQSLNKVVKEISEGERSATFRSASPIDFEYASNLNVGKDASDNAVGSFAEWSANSKNISSAMNHHITDNKSLVGVQGKKLQEIADILGGGVEGVTMSKDEADRLRTLARRAEREKATTGVWDTTKEDQIRGIYTSKGNIVRVRGGDRESIGTARKPRP